MYTLKRIHGIYVVTRLGKYKMTFRFLSLKEALKHIALVRRV